MQDVVSKMFEEHQFDRHLLTLIREFSGEKTSDVDIFVKRIMATSTGHEHLFGCIFRFLLGPHNVKIVSKYETDQIILELRSRKFSKLKCAMHCKRTEIVNFDDWVEKTNAYFDMCEQFLYFIVHQFKSGLLICNVCNKYHFTDAVQTCTSCLRVYNQTSCPVCKSYFGTQPHCHE